MLKDQIGFAVAQIKLLAGSIQVEAAPWFGVKDQQIEQSILIGIAEDSTLNPIALDLNTRLGEHIVEAAIIILTIQATGMIDVEASIGVEIRHGDVLNSFVTDRVGVQPEEFVRKRLRKGAGDEQQRDEKAEYQSNHADQAGIQVDEMERGNLRNNPLGCNDDWRAQVRTTEGLTKAG